MANLAGQVNQTANRFTKVLFWRFVLAPFLTCSHVVGRLFTKSSKNQHCQRYLSPHQDEFYPLFLNEDLFSRKHHEFNCISIWTRVGFIVLTKHQTLHSHQTTATSLINRNWCPFQEAFPLLLTKTVFLLDVYIYIPRSVSMLCWLQMVLKYTEPRKYMGGRMGYSAMKFKKYCHSVDALKTSAGTGTQMASAVSRGIVTITGPYWSRWDLRGCGRWIAREFWWTRDREILVVGVCWLS